MRCHRLSCFALEREDVDLARELLLRDWLDPDRLVLEPELDVLRFELLRELLLRLVELLLVIYFPDSLYLPNALVIASSTLRTAMISSSGG